MSFEEIRLCRYILFPRLDRKIEFPAPTEEARARIMQIHARKMNVDPDVNYEELARYQYFSQALQFEQWSTNQCKSGVQTISMERNARQFVLRQA